jgi:hypothetical protein
MTAGPAAAAKLAVINRRAHVGDFHLKHFLHRFLDLRLGGGARNLEDRGVLRLSYAETFFGDDRPANNFVDRERNVFFLGPYFLPLSFALLCAFAGALLDAFADFAGALEALAAGAFFGFSAATGPLDFAGAACCDTARSI